MVAAESPRGIFGIPLNVSIKYANVAISLTNDHGESFIYGYVPIVVAKCGVFLKEKGEQTWILGESLLIRANNSNRHRRYLSAQRIGQAHQRSPGGLRLSRAIWQRTRLDRVHCPRCSERPSPISEPAARAHRAPRVL